MPVYATRADYEASAYGSTPAPADIDNRLVRASLRIDELLVSAVYDVDTGDLPTDADTAEAMREATIAQTFYAMDAEDEQGRVWTSVSIGSVALSAGSAPAPHPYGTQYSANAVALLHTAELLPGRPLRC